MRREDEVFLIKQWRWYYFNFQDSIKLPYRFKEREFGYRTFDGKMVRHITFPSENEFKAFLIQKVPQSIFYSVSFYEEPTLSTEERGWKGADLVFDIDLSDIDAKCKKEHDFWICNVCGEIGKIPEPEKCPRCSSQDVQKHEWICDNCISALKAETIKLLDILELDFGIPSENIKVFFSGNLGFHVSVEGTILEKLNNYERAEIVDYITGRGFDPKIFRRNLVNRGYRSRDFTKTSSINVVKIDPNVSIDIHRIFRLPNSLHEKSGLVKGECRDLLDCDPFTEFVPFGDEKVQIFVKYFPGIKIKGERFPTCKGRCAVPKFLAIYLISKGLASIVGNA